MKHEDLNQILARGIFKMMRKYGTALHREYVSDGKKVLREDENNNPRFYRHRQFQETSFPVSILSFSIFDGEIESKLEKITGGNF